MQIFVVAGSDFLKILFFFYSAVVFVVVVVCFDFDFNLSPSWRSVVGSIFSSEERKKVAS